MGARLRQHQTCHFRKQAASAPAELGGEIHNVSRNRDRKQVLPQAHKLHVYGRGSFGAFGAFPSLRAGAPLSVLLSRRSTTGDSCHAPCVPCKTFEQPKDVEHDDTWVAVVGVPS